MRAARWAVTVALLPVAVMAAPAQAVKPIPVTTITLDQAAPAFQDTVTFTTTGTEKMRNPRIILVCYQGDDLVYGENGALDYGFILGGYSSPWTMLGGGPADCTATIADYVWKGKWQVGYSGASIAFHVTD